MWFLPKLLSLSAVFSSLERNPGFVEVGLRAMPSRLALHVFRCAPTIRFFGLDMTLSKLRDCTSHLLGINIIRLMLLKGSYFILHPDTGCSSLTNSCHVFDRALQAKGLRQSTLLLITCCLVVNSGRCL